MTTMGLVCGTGGTALSLKLVEDVSPSYPVRFTRRVLSRSGHPLGKRRWDDIGREQLSRFIG